MCYTNAENDFLLKQKIIPGLATSKATIFPKFNDYLGMAMPIHKMP